jgi:hypothetical protein
MAQPLVYRNTAALPDRFCLCCGALIPRTYPNGRPMQASAFAQRLYCSDACARACAFARVPTSQDQRFWAKVDRHGPLWQHTPCWLWTAHRDSAGYGKFSQRLGRRQHRYIRAHRYAYETCIGHIPDGYDIDHLCRTPSCVNPDHLEAVPRKENLRRGIGYGGALRTHCKHGHELTPDNLVTCHKGTMAFQRCRLCYAASRRQRTALLRERRAARQTMRSD